VGGVGCWGWSGQLFEWMGVIVGIRCFEQIMTDVHFLRTTYRFKDKITDEKCAFLPALFEYMRDPRGKPMPHSLWKRLQQCLAKGADDARLADAEQRSGYEMGIVWESVGRLQQYD
jgi:hypothetical protein